MADVSMDNEMKIDEVFPRPNTLFLRGVDNLSTAEIKTYVKLYTDKDFKIEWINDTSLNVVFEEEVDATEALKKLSKTDEDIEGSIEREAHLIDESNLDGIFYVRISNTNDKKIKGAAQYSRYYLFHPKEERDYRKSRKSTNYRERENNIRRNRRNNEEIEDDLFPEKPIDPIRQEDTTNDNIDDERSQELSSRIGSSGSTNLNTSKFVTSELDDDDLFKR